MENLISIMHENERYMTVKALVDIMYRYREKTSIVGERTLQRWANKKEVKAIRIGKTILINVDDVHNKICTL